MYHPAAATPAVVASLPGQGFHYLFSMAPETTPIEAMNQWRWIGVRGPRTYEMGAAQSDVARASVQAVTDLAALGPASPAGPPVVLPCDGTKVSIPRLAVGTTRILLDSPAAYGVRLFVSDDLAPLPWVPAIVSSVPVALRCSGVASVTVSVTSNGPPA